MGKLLNAYSDLDLDPTKLNIELVRAIFIYYNLFQFRVPYSSVFQKRNYENETANMFFLKKLFCYGQSKRCKRCYTVHNNYVELLMQKFEAKKSIVAPNKSF